MKKNRLLALLIACLMMVTMLACGTSAVAESDAELTLWIYGWETASADKIIEDAVAYEAETGVKINVVPVSSDSYGTKILATISGGENPDLAFLDAGVQSTQLAAKGKLLDLTPYGVESLKDKFYDSVWDTLVYKDGVYGLRITANNLALLYNKEMFANAGIEEPNADWTWDDLRTAAKALTDPENNIYGIDLPVYNANGGYCWNWLPFFWQNGGVFLNEDRTEATFNSEAGVEALEFWRTLLLEDKSAPMQAPATGVNRFSSGQIAMIIDGPWTLRGYLEDPNFCDKLGVAMLPMKEQKATVVGGEGVAIFADTEYPQEAYDYLVHLCCSEFTQVFWQNWITIPPQPEFKDFYADDEMYGEYIQVFSDQMEFSQTRPFTPTWPQIENAMGLDLQAYMYGEMDSAQEALDLAAADINAILAE